MPELPEVETTLRGIAPHIIDCTIQEVIVRRHDLRIAVPQDLDSLASLRVLRMERRAKYLLACLGDGTSLLIHLGMSGSLRLCQVAAPWKTHDHVALTLSSGKQLRFHDPRRFGIFTHLTGDPLEHPLLRKLGPEPLGDEFTAEHLSAACQGRRSSIKATIMDARCVVGVGNIYASEALFLASIRPSTPACRLSKARLARLVEAIRMVLSDAIAQGGTTLRDFLNADGQPGYFRQSLRVYDRKGQSCHVCASKVCHAIIAQRSTYWCPKCQK